LLGLAGGRLLLRSSGAEYTEAIRAVKLWAKPRHAALYHLTY